MSHVRRVGDTSLASSSYSASFSLRSFTLVPPCWPRTVSLSSNTLSHSGGHNVYSITVPNHTFWYQSANSPVAPHDVMKMSVMVQVQTVNDDSDLNNRIAWLDLIYDEHDLCGEFLAFFLFCQIPTNGNQSRRAKSFEMDAAVLSITYQSDVM